MLCAIQHSPRFYQKLSAISLRLNAFVTHLIISVASTLVDTVNENVRYNHSSLMEIVVNAETNS